MDKASTLVMQPTSTFCKSRRFKWGKKSKGLASLLMCCAFIKKEAPTTPMVESKIVVDDNNNPITTSGPSSNTTTTQDDLPIEQEKTNSTELNLATAETAATVAVQEKENDSKPSCLLDPIEKKNYDRKCLVLDLDETLIHSSFKTVAQADFVVPVEIDGSYHNVFVLKRPGVDDFMKRMGELYEIVIFTASLSKYADPVLDKLDLHKVINHRLFRESCHSFKGTYIKDLSRLGRDLKHVMILDNSPICYSLHPSNAVPVSSWFNDQHDSELIDLIPFLEDLAKVDDVVDVLDISL